MHARPSSLPEDVRAKIWTPTASCSSRSSGWSRSSAKRRRGSLKKCDDRTPRCRGDSIIGTRNRLIHGYDKVNLNIVWTIVQDNLPTLIADLNDILGDVE